VSTSDHRIWAPWRIDYILGPKSTTCPFCEAPAQGASAQSLILAERAHTFVILNRYPYTGCHIMVCPKQHVAAIGQLEPHVYSELMELVRLSTERLQKACEPSGMNIGINQGTAAGAGISEHLHVHIVPRWAGDTNFMLTVGQTRVLSQDVEHAWEILRPEFSELDKA